MVTATHAGCAVGFYRGDVAVLLEDIEELQPTLFPSVPRLYNRIYDKVRVPGTGCLGSWMTCNVSPGARMSGGGPWIHLRIHAWSSLSGPSLVAPWHFCRACQGTEHGTSTGRAACHLAS